ncbi:thioredoxin [Candidatus Pacearchaeota archaeon RBG_13_36_9]|nr:MAG: thioredoxin [Candidatus Pacearchaeota archaeon RBG_13_36_9]
MLHLTSDNFEKEVAKSKIPVVVDFFADWCMPCQMMAPIFENLSKKLGSKMKFAKIDTQSEMELSQRFNITGIPCLIVFKNGKEASRIAGFMQAEELEEKLKGYL